MPFLRLMKCRTRSACGSNERVESTVSLALGYSCVVYDFGSRDKKRGVPRALWYGTEFVRYALDWYWFDAKDDTQTPILR